MAGFVFLWNRSNLLTFPISKNYFGRQEGCPGHFDFYWVAVLDAVEEQNAFFTCKTCKHEMMLIYRNLLQLSYWNVVVSASKYPALWETLGRVRCVTKLRSCTNHKPCTVVEMNFARRSPWACVALWLKMHKAFEKSSWTSSIKDDSRTWVRQRPCSLSIFFTSSWLRKLVGHSKETHRPMRIRNIFRYIEDKNENRMTKRIK